MRLRLILQSCFLVAFTACSKDPERSDAERPASAGLGEKHIATSNFLGYADAHSPVSDRGLRDIDHLFIIVNRATDEYGTSRAPDGFYDQKDMIRRLSLLSFSQPWVTVVSEGTSIPSAELTQQKSAIMFVSPSFVRRDNASSFVINYYLNRIVVFPWSKSPDWATVDRYSDTHGSSNPEALAKAFKADIEKYIETRIEPARRRSDVESDQ